MNLKAEYKVIIAGSRKFDRYRLLKKVCDRLLPLHTNVTVISGTAVGADKLGEKYAEAHKLYLERYPAQWTKYGKKAGILRNIEMAKVADALIAFWDGKSPGTKHMINIARRKGLQVHVERI